MEVKVVWQEGLRFLGTASKHTIVIDTVKEFGGFESAPAPMELLLLSLASCTGMDVVSILKKMKIKITKFEIDVIGKKKEDHPKYFTNIQLTYRFYGTDLPIDRIKHAVELSQDKYCSVTAHLKAMSTIEYEIEIVQD